ncbi:MAG: primosomal protein N' [Oscillospiraceae bacterium]|nr:primosomal protein N' [Oscillospiraceae bacterium]
MESLSLTARVAVDVTYALDLVYEYAVPEASLATALPGSRVAVPFGRGNTLKEGVILALTDAPDYQNPKALQSVLDPAPLISSEQLALAKFMKARFFCSLYDALRAIIPVGLWYKIDPGGRHTENVRGKTAEFALLTATAERAAEYAARTKSVPQSEILRYLLRDSYAPLEDIYYYTGAKRPSLKSLEAKGYITIEKREAFRKPQVSELIAAEAISELTDEQTAAYRRFLPLVNSGKPECGLLYGVTGSGKTSVYIRLIEKAASAGRGAIFLVPEISLTPQLTALFIRHFGEAIAVLHSSLTAGQRADEWKRVNNGSASVVIGTRSAVFAPVKNLGLIIIDEEQEGSYISDSSPRYNAVAVAKYRAAKSDAFLLLGSATPSVEAYHAAQSGRYAYAELLERYNRMKLPEVIIADTRDDLNAGRGGAIGSILQAELAQRLEKGEQSILFINRRGANTVVSCPACGYVFNCPNCSMRLTYHKVNGRLMCHLCGHSVPLPYNCPDCHGALKFSGVGTQQVVTEVEALFPGVPLLRMDADALSAGNSHSDILGKFETEKIPILIGTQMVTKGLNFPNVTLVGVINADNSLYASDYRAFERTFALITQVIGRAGRADKPGRAVIQTFSPLHELIQAAAAQDYKAFYALEIETRKLSGAPPFCSLYTLNVSGEERVPTETCAAELRAVCEQLLPQGSLVLGPAPAQVIRVNKRYRYIVTAVTRNDNAIFRAAIADITKRFILDKRFRQLAIYAQN